VPISGLFTNQILLIGLIAWALAQIVKVPYEYLFTRRWNWSLLLQAGGMPSSHSALVISISYAVGLYTGFDSAEFAIAVMVCMVVVYDATGIRRQAGMHAALINAMINDLATGHPLKGEQLREVLGHTPLEALAGVIFGLAVAQVMYWLWN
jgi:acid phosphatase family membrane protein YuiD